MAGQKAPSLYSRMQTHGTLTEKRNTARTIDRRSPTSNDLDNTHILLVQEAFCHSPIRIPRDASTSSMRRPSRFSHHYSGPAGKD
jgi:hypothetical protein